MQEHQIINVSIFIPEKRKRRSVVSCSILQERNSDNSDEESSDLGSSEGGSSTSEWDWATGSIGLDLSVWDLRNETTGWHDGRSWGSGWDLDLSITDLGDWGRGRWSGGWDLDLSVTDLGDWGGWCWSLGWDLDLSVADLGDWGAGWGGDGGGGLDLTVADLGDWC